MRDFTRAMNDGLVWLPQLGVGRYPVPPERPYDDGYFLRYQGMAETEMGRALTKARIALVARHYSGSLLDVGIGAGQFVDSRPDTLGYDVNAAGIAWLKERGKWADLYAGEYDALAFWDSLEHIDDPEEAVSRARECVFVSIPIFSGAEDVLSSRHFRPDEHIWYFTHEGLIAWFERMGFACVECNREESRLGREGINSYAFKRV
ncbi:methyltransferase domain-containing protein [Erwinia sp. HR93]|uniref:methyltransferase domain-containing protein n=1 Tax=Erwinia sp. HR93 TaxID=3094840 RepID=UPI002ADEE43A|nr:methyltransferase domain-containing protein [Erwinia sp. HR93]MEA1064730.1 methyltransferase domain-containing protein [Erwinia sp. HR93]